MQDLLSSLLFSEGGIADKSRGQGQFSPQHLFVYTENGESATPPPRGLELLIHHLFSYVTGGY